MIASAFQPVESLVEIANPGMITVEEEQLYLHLARSYWSPDRFYFEFGPWLGRSTARICQGLQSVAPGRWRLNCYDLFRWKADHIPKAMKAGMPSAVAGLGSIQTITAARIDVACDRLEATIPSSKLHEATLTITRPVLLWACGFQTESQLAAEKLKLSPAQRDAVSKRLQRQPILNVPPIVACVA
jgi:hypothetical protein